MADLDEALDRFQRCACAYGPGLPNYGPMAATALVELGHDALLVGLIDIYVPRLPDLDIGAPIDATERDSALGRNDMFARWCATFEGELESDPWPVVLAREAPRLADGIGPASIHGLVRTACAVQALGAKETPVRERELAFGLAHWACCYEESSDANSGDDVSMDERIRTACLEGASRYLADPDQRAANTVGVTGPGAIVLLSPHLAAETAARALGSIAVLVPSAPVPVAGAQKPGMVDDAEVARCAESVPEIAYRAACSLQEHAIPFVAACLREDAARPDPALRIAAADAALRLSPPGYQAWR